MSIALTYVVGSKHEEFIFLKTKTDRKSVV